MDGRGPVHDHGDHYGRDDQLMCVRGEAVAGHKAMSDWRTIS